MSAADTGRDPPSAPPTPPSGSELPTSANEAAGAAPSLLRAAIGVLAVVAAAGLVSSGLLWQKLSTIQEQLARQSADAGSHATEARALARQAQELARDVAARQAVQDTRLNEVALQRTQLEELMQSLSRSRDENLVVDIEAGLRLAQQQAQLTLSAEPLLAALRTADQRLARAGEPRLARIRSAIARDIDRIKSAAVTDVPGILLRLDEVARQIDELPLANGVGAAGARRAAPSAGQASPAPPNGWRKLLDAVREEARSLVRVSRIDEPDAMLLAPEQGFFLRENFKLKLMNARLALLSRQIDAARADVGAAAAALDKYFDASARRTQAVAQSLQQMQRQLRVVEVPRIDETLATLATAAAGR
ncbi:uroporphyrinogen-III C-methyltransferase [Ramlibacter sp.]|uniref:uroporphyrinogen-III C-methyltransferase n=1 Tax=Ramlibacter sp. TaxID=1917967 RepID=UPI002D3A2E3E|nr:uroporphyrinogen-III C-methyltransferase [Ramlibacter sp.]HYD74847.1 uroporphyrinogen-III C-methyltransferase [Ramlibacter sp.]